MTISSDCLLYLISPPDPPQPKNFAALCEACFSRSEGLIGAFQLRLKQSGSDTDGRLTELAPSDDVVRSYADVIVPLCQKYGITFILNDNPQLAIDIGADGVHLGQDDEAVRQARQLLGEDYIIGASCHASRHIAMQAGDDGADYVAFGAFYPTMSKSSKALEHWGTPTPDILDWWVSVATLPCVAIGGITPQNCSPLVQAGADFLAVISSVWQYDDGAATAIDAFKHAISHALELKHDAG